MQCSRSLTPCPSRSETCSLTSGSGVGRVTTLVHLMTGATCVGVEVQPALAEASRQLALRLALPQVQVVEGEVLERFEALSRGTVFFLYCPFSGARLEQLLAEVEVLARQRTLHLACVDVPLPERPWLVRVASRDVISVFRTERAVVRGAQSTRLLMSSHGHDERGSER